MRLSGALGAGRVAGQSHADRQARRPKPCKRATNDRLQEYVQDRLLGGEVPGPSDALDRAAPRAPTFSDVARVLKTRGGWSVSGGGEDGTALFVALLVFCHFRLLRGR